MIAIFKLSGAVFLMAACTLAGYQKGETYALRVKTLQEILIFFRYIEADLHYRRAQTREIIADALRRCEIKFLPLSFADFEEEDYPTALASALKLFCERETAAKLLGKEELKIFCEALQSLGKYSASEEEQKLGYVIALFENAQELAQQKALQERKLCRALGLSCGAAAALLLV